MASRDFLGGFGWDGGQAPAGGAAAGAGGESDEIELSLGLSLGGCFSANPSQDGKQPPRLLRSSSIASICSLPATCCGGAQDAAAAATAPPPDQLLRTSSLPTEYMEDRLRRRAMQSQRRLEAKRKRLERRNSMNSGRPVPAAGGGTAGRDEGLEHTVPSGFQLRRTIAALMTAGSPTPSRPQQGGGRHMRAEQGGRRWSTHSWRRRGRTWQRRWRSWRGRGPVTPSCNGTAPAADTPSSSSSSSSYVRAALDRQLCRSVDHVIVLLCSSRARNRNWDERLMVVICCFGDLDDSFSGRQHGVRDCQSAVEQGPRFLAAAETTDFVHAIRRRSGATGRRSRTRTRTSRSQGTASAASAAPRRAGAGSTPCPRPRK
ncbi:ninja-family protein 5-like isoform X1 [Miscanthus floridulus]|uniref:ninja-family protein 5-like isoform X1 n=1 Tax=Miscanthus floridulus TaxID=154761 RepID=UPI00345B3519